MAKKKLAKLAKELDFKESLQVIEYIIESYWVGQKKQCKNLYARIHDSEKQMATSFIQAKSTEVYKFLTK